MRSASKRCAPATTTGLPAIPVASSRRDWARVRPAWCSLRAASRALISILGTVALAFAARLLPAVGCGCRVHARAMSRWRGRTHPARVDTIRAGLRERRRR